MKIDTNALILAQILGGDGSSVTVEPLSVTSNGTYTAEDGTAYSPVSVNVSSTKPSYLISDGDSVTGLYFNTNYDLDQWLSGLTYNETFPSPPLAFCTIYDGLLYAGDLSSVGLGNGYFLYGYDGVNITAIYSTIAFDASAYIQDLNVETKGWQLTQVVFPTPITINFSSAIPSFLDILDEVVAGSSVCFGGLTIRRTKVSSNNIHYTSTELSNPADQANLIATSSIAVPNNEAILDISYIAGIQGGIGKYSTGVFIMPGAGWNTTTSDITVTKTVGQTDTTISVTCDKRTDPVIATALGLPCDCGTLDVSVFLEVISKK